jgi:hypothetical protein
MPKYIEHQAHQHKNIPQSERKLLQEQMCKGAQSKDERGPDSRIKSVDASEPGRSHQQRMFEEMEIGTPQRATIPPLQFLQESGVASVMNWRSRSFFN